MPALTITLDGSKEDLEMIRVRIVAVVEEEVDELSENLSGSVDVNWELDE